MPRYIGVFRYAQLTKSMSIIDVSCAILQHAIAHYIGYTRSTFMLKTPAFEPELLPDQSTINAVSGRLCLIFILEPKAFPHNFIAKCRCHKA